MSDVTKTQENEVETKHQAPRLNERILSSLSRRTVAAHPWHDLEIGIFAEDDCICHLYLICIQDNYEINCAAKKKNVLCRAWSSPHFQCREYFC